MPDSQPPAPATATAPSVPPLQLIASRPLRWLLQACAWLFLALGIAGAFIPGLPTTVFILLAGGAAARSSQRLHRWLWLHRLFGPMLQDWAAGGRVSRPAKWGASAAMAVGAVLVCWVPVAVWVRWLSLLSMAGVLLWLWSRPEPAVRNTTPPGAGK